MSLKKYNVLDNEWDCHVGRFVKGSISNAHARQIIERDLRASQQQSNAKAARRKLARRKLDGKVAQKGRGHNCGRCTGENIETLSERGGKDQNWPMIVPN